MSDPLRCPFCDEDDFDAIGLKHHLLAGHCDPFVAVAGVTRPTRPAGDADATEDLLAYGQPRDFGDDDGAP